eukprot:1158171-Pelagomonas_calceolata.AAC.3
MAPVPGSIPCHSQVRVQYRGFCSGLVEVLLSGSKCAPVYWAHGSAFECPSKPECAPMHWAHGSALSAAVLGLFSA